jgi:polyhydroxyalkanoate synthesis regulator phasin
MRRKWLIAIAAAAIALIVAGGAVFAAARRGESGVAPVQADRRSDDQDKLLVNVAAKLGLDVAKVKDAHQQAVKVVEAEQRTRLLNDLVAKGRMTREQADAISSWLASRPDSASRLPGLPGLSGIAGAGAWMMPAPGVHKWPGAKPAAAPNDVFVKMAALLGKDIAAVEKAFKAANDELAKERRKNDVNDHLDRLVKDGVITAQEAAEISAWVEKAPAFLSDGTTAPYWGPPGLKRGTIRPGGHLGGQFRFFGPDGTGPVSPFGREFGPEDLEGMDELFDSLPDTFRQFGIPWHGMPGAAPGTPAPSQPAATPGAKGA